MLPAGTSVSRSPPRWSTGGPLNSRLNLSNSRLIAIGLLVGAILLLGLLVVLPLVSMNSKYADNVEDLQFRLAKYRKVAAGKEAWTQRLEDIRQRGEEEDRFISRDTAALASADLQTRIKQAVTDAGGELISTQVFPERKEEQFSRVAVKVRMTGGTPVLRDVLYAFEAGKPVMFVENLNIRPIRVGQPSAPGGKPAKIPDRLSIDFDVVGYMRGGME